MENESGKFEILPLQNGIFALHKQGSPIVKSMLVYPCQCSKRDDRVCTVSGKQCANPLVFPKHCTLEKHYCYRLEPIEINLNDMRKEIEKQRKNLQKRLNNSCMNENYVSNR